MSPPPLPLTWIVSDVSLRSPCRRFFELGPIARFSVPLFSFPRNDGRVKSTWNVKRVIFGNSNVSVNDVM